MSNETKREVFETFADERAGLNDEIYKRYLKQYDAALPDDLPVIPKAVGDVIVKLKHKKFSLSGAMSYAAVVSLSPWMTFEHEDTFALAWVLGAWKVEETGEIVKLEAEK
ncbi:hypothetical protein BN934_02819 [Lacticaseibacillus rhamnosus]|uniref:hypothetical protein n=1 Tax=Lacticaseibacillus rhamnosus TaxID=47715 RepID=UPI0005E176BD|nr:hypothetical protein [Lacticaseibacillus rhamnosus]CDN24562.1 hypothetical protein BN934_02819 [Lacticaseibacillus rhamnosus]